jgi:SAM-dependent methyltransferase
MPEKTDFVERYASGNTPWDSGTPSAEMLRVLKTGKLTGSTVLDFGCGTGTNAIELARRGFHVTATDIVPQAIQRAHDKGREAAVQVDFRVADALRDDPGGPYDILFDRGVYHCLRTLDLKAFQEFLRRATHIGSWWLSLAGNSKEAMEPGPPVVSESEIRTELEPLFNILELREFRFATNQEGFSPLGWSILMQRK